MKMRKTLFFALFVIMLVTLLASCSNIKCMEPFNDHAIVIDEAVDPTCTTTGLTQGKHCSDCGMVFVAQTIIPETAHTEVVDKAVASTCSQPGLTEGSHCAECGLVFVKQEEVAKLPHNEVVALGKAPTCTTDGSTDRTYCSVCKVTLVPSIKIEKGHRNVITLNAVDSTCYSVGSTEGKFCTDCMTIIDGYLIIPKKDHVPGAWTVEKEATQFEEGKKYQLCTVCNEVANEEIIPQIADFAYTVNADGVSCTITAVTVYADIELYIPEYIDGYKVTAIGDEAFYNQKQIIVAYIPGTVETIGARAFYGCTALVSVSISDGVKTIGTYAFYNCSRLMRVMLPGSLTTIGNYAFDRCTKLNKVYYAGNVEMWNGVEVADNNDAVVNANNIHYYSLEDPSTFEFRTGIYEDNGTLYYYVNGVKTYGGLMIIDGAYYYARTSGEVLSGISYGITKTNDLLPVGTYTFDAEGKMVNPPVEAGEDSVVIPRYWHYVDGVPARW